MMKQFVFLLFAAVAFASPLHDADYEPKTYLKFVPAKYDYYDDDLGASPVVYLEENDFPIVGRHRRSLQPGAPQPGAPQSGDYGTQVIPQIGSQGGTTNAGATIQHKTKNYDVEANWNKNIRGPGRAKPDWQVRGTYRW